MRFIAGFPICIQYEFSIKKTYVFGYDNNIFFSHFFPISNFSIAKVKFYVVYTENNKKFIKTFFLKLTKCIIYFLYQKFINVDFVVRTITHVI